MQKKTIYEWDGIRIATTGRDYDFIATVENDSDNAVELRFTGDYAEESGYEEYFEPFIVPPHDWVGICGWKMLEAFENGCFEVNKTTNF